MRSRSLTGRARAHRIASSAGFLVLLASAASAQGTFISLDGVPGAISANPAAISGDGSTVVGSAWDVSADRSRAIHWTPSTGLRFLDDLVSTPYAYDFANAVSFDGSVVLARTGAVRSIRWSSDGATVDLGDLPNGLGQVRALSISGDGDTIVGSAEVLVTPSRETVAFRWTAPTGIRQLESLPGETRSSGELLSADGRVGVGLSGATPVTFDDVSPVLTPLDVGVPSTPAEPVLVTALSADASTLVGQYGSPFVPFKWNASDGLVPLDTGAAEKGGARDVTADGRLVAGFVLNDDVRPTLWDADEGRIDVQFVLEQFYGIDLSGWDLEHIRAISDDGRTITGSGINPAGQRTGWIASVDSWTVPVPEPSTALLLGLGLAALARSRPSSSV